jgi:hypothetical protein
MDVDCFYELVGLGDIANNAERCWWCSVRLERVVQVGCCGLVSGYIGSMAAALMCWWFCVVGGSAAGVL